MKKIDSDLSSSYGYGFDNYISNYSKSLNEMNRRYDLFIQNRVKSIESFNDKVDKETKIPYIVVVISELFEILKFKNTRDIISELLLNCKRAGIIIIAFSKFNKKKYTINDVRRFV